MAVCLQGRRETLLWLLPLGSCDSYQFSCLSLFQGLWKYELQAEFLPLANSALNQIATALKQNTHSIFFFKKKYGLFLSWSGSDIYAGLHKMNLFFYVMNSPALDCIYSRLH